MTSLLTENLPVFFSAPNGVKKLRELILQLAVMGKLVPQDPNDEPASALLKRIQADQVRLNKAKSLSSTGEGERPFALPEHWEWLRLGDLATTITKGSSPKWQGVNYTIDPDDVLFITSENVGRFGLRMDEPKYVERKFNQIEPRSILRNGDFLMNIVGASIGRTAIFNIDALANINQAVCLIRVEAKNVVDSSYLLNFFNSETCLNYMYDKQVDNARANLSLGNIGRFLIPLPPLEEQHRILAKVDELMALCDRLDAQQADAESAHTLIVKTLLETLTQSKDPAEFANGWERIKQNFDTLFTTEASIDALKQTLLQLAVMGKLVPQDPNDEAASELLKRLIDQKVRLEQETNRKPGIVSQSTSVTKLFGEPNSWVWARFNDVVQISSGVTLGKKLDDKMTVSKPYLRVANVQRGYLVLDQIKEIEILPEHVEKYVLRVNDLLLTEGGDWDKVGRTAIWRGEIPECLHQNHIFKARRLLPELDVGWAQLYLNSPIARSYFEASAKQTTNLASINMTQLRNCPFPLPPLAEQRRIVAKVEELGGLCDRLKAALISARTFQHLLATTLIVGAVNNSALAPQEKEQVMAFR